MTNQKFLQFMALLTFIKLRVTKAELLCSYNKEEELLFVGKARKVRQRVKKHFEDNVSPIKDHRDEVTENQDFLC